MEGNIFRIPPSWSRRYEVTIEGEARQAPQVHVQDNERVRPASQPGRVCRNWYSGPQRRPRRGLRQAILRSAIRPTDSCRATGQVDSRSAISRYFPAIRTTLGNMIIFATMPPTPMDPIETHGLPVQTNRPIAAANVRTQETQKTRPMPDHISTNIRCDCFDVSIRTPPYFIRIQAGPRQWVAHAGAVANASAPCNVCNFRAM